jgi:glycogen synthase
MRALVVADVVGGVRTFVRELTQGCSPLDVEFDLALIGPSDGAVSLGGESVTSCELREFRLEWMDDPWADLKATSRWIGELCERHDPDLIHMNTFAPVPDPELPVLLTFHSCVLTWWRAVRGSEAPAHWNRYRRLVRAALDRADLITFPSRALAAAVSDVYGALGPSRVIPNGREVTVPQVPREQLVVAAGRIWDEAKNVSLVASAAEAIRARVAAIGPGEAHGIESIGAVSEAELLRWLASAAVFVEPARYEPFGLTALEAALCGCALVLGDIPSLREVWGTAASYVSPDDAEALAASVNALLEDPWRRRRAAIRARTAALRYNPAAMANAYAEAYQRLAPAPVIA